MASEAKSLELTPYHAEARNTEKGFDLVIHGVTEGNKPHRVTIEMTISFLTYMAPLLHQALADKEAALALARAALTGS